MNAKAADRSQVPFNPRMFRWAREWRGRTLQEVAEHLKKTVADVAMWESPGSENFPTVRQARELAEFYGRPFLEFFLDEPPELSPPLEVPDFRLHRDHKDPREVRELEEIQSWAEEQRLNALDLFEMLGEEPPSFPSTASVASTEVDPEEAAGNVRGHMDFPLSVQINCRPRDRYKLPTILRKQIESLGVITLKRGELTDLGVRGICIAIFPLPIIVISTEAPTAQAFSLAHELGHVCLRQSAISGQLPAKSKKTRAKAVEDWCNRFAGAFLVPNQALAGLIERPNIPNKKIDDTLLSNLANEFCISRHAMLVRLVQLGYIEKKYYWQGKRAQLLKEEAEYKLFGRNTFYSSRFRSRQGNLYTSLVLDALSSGYITYHSAAEFMGTKYPDHIVELRARFNES